MAAARMGNRVLKECGRLMVFVQGAGESDEGNWGESFIGAKKLMTSRSGPVALTNMSKLVISPHSYGPALYGSATMKKWM